MSARIERRFSENPDLAFAECWYWIRKLQARFFAGDYASAIEASSRAQRLLWTSVSQLETAEYHFYGALSQAASCDSAAAGERQQHLDAVAAHHKQLQLWAANCPDNFENRAALVGAEIARIEGRELDAMRLYEQAIRSARANGFVHNEALANELAARFYAARGFEKIARVYLQERPLRLSPLGSRWQGAATRTASSASARRAGAAHLPPRPLARRSSSSMSGPCVKASQAVSSEIVLGKLIETLMTIAVEHAGAERGLLILSGEDEPRIEAEATTGRRSGRSHAAPDSRDHRPSFPNPSLHYVIRTRESVILDDAARPNIRSRRIDYLRSSKPGRSSACRW